MRPRPVRLLAASIAASALLLTAVTGGALAEVDPNPDPGGIDPDPAIVEPEQPPLAPIQITHAATADKVEVFTGSLASGAAELPADLDAALTAAEELADANPDDLAPPYALFGRVVAKPTTDRGEKLVGTLAGSYPGLVSPIASGTRAAHSLAALNTVKDEVIELDAAALPGSSGMYAAFVQSSNDRVVIEATTVSDELRAALAARYGAGKIAIHHTPGEELPDVMADGRTNDGNPFEGGSKIWGSGGPCTSGFSWSSATYGRMMLTAGHCTTNPGTVSTAVTFMGNVVRDNWGNGVGSLKVDGVYRGDLSLVDVKSGASSAGYVHVGGPRSTTNRRVAGKFSRRARVGDRYCTDGAARGQVCNWRITWTRGVVRYRTGTIARNVYRGIKHYACTMPGDSGGPDYIVTSSGTIIAKGILSGGGGGGGDYYAGILELPCTEFGTDIWDAYVSMPGDLLVG
jgi:hypothetical protein